MSRLRGVSVKQVRSWAEDRYNQPISESDTQQVAAREKWADVQISTCSFTVIWFVSWKSALRVS